MIQQIFSWVERNSIHTHFKMEVSAGRPAGITNFCDQLAFLNPVSRFDQQTRGVSIAGFYS